jgi:hypothetical protein
MQQMKRRILKEKFCLLALISLGSLSAGFLLSCGGSGQTQLSSKGTQMNIDKSHTPESLYEHRDRAVSIIASLALDMNVANQQFIESKNTETTNMRPIKCFEDDLLWRTEVIIHSSVVLERNVETDRLMNATIQKIGGTLNYVEKNVLTDGSTEWRYDIKLPDGFASLILIREAGISFSVATPCGAL